MSKINNFKKNLNFKSLNSFIKSFRKKISRSYLLIEFGYDFLNLVKHILLKDVLILENKINRNSSRSF